MSTTPKRKKVKQEEPQFQPETIETPVEPVEQQPVYTEQPIQPVQPVQPVTPPSDTKPEQGTPYTTNLSPAEEAAFRAWYSGYADVTGNNPDPDDPAHHYDYRGYWQANPSAEVSKGMHLPDTWKTPGHETFSIESKYAKGNERQAGYWDVATGAYVAPPPAGASDLDVLEWERGREVNRTAAEQLRIREQRVEQAKKQAEENKAAADAANAAITQAEEDNLNALEGDLKEAQKEDAAETAEMSAEIEGARQAARWTGLGELATSIVNVISAGAHGNNMPLPSFSQDWMAKADSAIKERRAKVRDMSARIRQMKSNIESVRSGNLKNKAARDLAATKEYNADLGKIYDAIAEGELSREEFLSTQNLAANTAKTTQLGKEAIEKIRANGRKNSGPRSTRSSSDPFSIFD